MEEKIIKAYNNINIENPKQIGWVDMQQLYKILKPITIAKFKEAMTSFIEKYVDGNNWRSCWGSYLRPEVKRYGIIIGRSRVYYYIQRLSKTPTQAEQSSVS